MFTHKNEEVKQIKIKSHWKREINIWFATR